MLEYPECKVYAGQMSETLTGQTIRAVEVEHDIHRFAFFRGDKKTYDDLLSGETVESASSHGGHIELFTEHYVLTFSDGAYPRLYDLAHLPAKRQLMITFENDMAICVTIAMYGGIALFPKENIKDSYYEKALNKPDMLGEAFTLPYFMSLKNSEKKLSFKAFLATEQRIPGLGNGIFQDIAWKAGIDPRYPVQSMETSDFEAAYHAIREVVQEMVSKGGRNTEKDFYGNTGGYIVQLSKNSYMEPCMKCGNLIEKANYMGGTIYFCTHCQKR